MLDVRLGVNGDVKITLHCINKSVVKVILFFIRPQECSKVSKRVKNDFISALAFLL